MDSSFCRLLSDRSVSNVVNHVWPKMWTVFRLSSLQVRRTEHRLDRSSVPVMCSMTSTGSRQSGEDMLQSLRWSCEIDSIPQTSLGKFWEAKRRYVKGV